MDLQNRRALLAIALLAARADGAQDESERTAVREALLRIDGAGLDAEALGYEIEEGRRELARTANELNSPEARELAYEIAACVCNADGATNEAERGFLASLSRALGLQSTTTERFRSEADALAATPIAAEAVPPLAPRASPADIDELISRQAILCGGLELLPHRLATLAILPLQMRLVYQIGKRYGFELDRGHVQEFLGVLGVGLTAQVIEGFARQLATSLFGRMGGGLVGGLAGGATGAGLSYATTYALGQAAQRYYSGGRKLSAVEMKDLFASLLGQARALEPRHAADIAASAGSVDLGSLQRLLSV